MKRPPRSLHLRSLAAPEGAVSPWGGPAGLTMRAPPRCRFFADRSARRLRHPGIGRDRALPVFSGSLRNASAADEWSRALLLAESQLDLAASVQPLKETTESGSDVSGTHAMGDRASSPIRRPTRAPISSRRRRCWARVFIA